MAAEGVLLRARGATSPAVVLDGMQAAAEAPSPAWQRHV